MAGCALQDRDALLQDVDDIVVARADASVLVRGGLERNIGLVVVGVARVFAHELLQLRGHLPAVSLRTVGPHGNALQTLARPQEPAHFHFGAAPGNELIGDGAYCLVPRRTPGARGRRHEERQAGKAGERP